MTSNYFFVSRKCLDSKPAMWLGIHIGSSFVTRSFALSVPLDLCFLKPITAILNIIFNIEEYVRTDSSGKEFPFLLNRSIEIVSCDLGPFYWRSNTL